MRSINGIGSTIYGKAKKQELFGNERVEAEQAGYLPYSYQVVEWFIIFFFPVVPLGTYRVLKRKQGFWSFKFSRYQMDRVPWDWMQVLRHYLIAYGWIVIVVVWLSLTAG